MIPRAFLYGDLLFETIRVERLKVQLAALHFERLKHGAALLHFEWPESFTQDFMEHLLLEQLQQKGMTNARVRLTVYRDSDGFYTPHQNKITWNVEVFELPEGPRILKNIGLYKDHYKACHALSGIKSGNALVYVMAALYAKQQSLDDAMIMNEKKQVIEGTSSNLFWVENNTVFTPPLQAGPVAGVMRRFLLENMTGYGITCMEAEAGEERLLDADELFFTNAVYGIMPVLHFGAKPYKTELVRLLQSVVQTTA